MTASTSMEPAELGIYAHVPFCERVCPYCDFAVEAAGRLDPQVERAYVDGLAREWELLRRRFGAALDDRPRATIYLGGGTPSLLSPRSIERVLGFLRGAGDAGAGEVTLELNPTDAELSRLRDFRAAGVTRLSLGLQSLRSERLRRLGRGHGESEARRGLELCCAAQFASISADLIYGSPGQGEAELLADVDSLIELGVPHVSAYALTLEPRTPFALAHERGQLPLPDEDAVRRMSRLLRARLAAAGLEQYEISSFARPGHRSRHNQRYWRRADVVGIGVSAASLLGDLRFQNERERKSWSARLAAGELPWAGSERLSLAEQRRETFALGLRRIEGVSRADYQRRFGAAPEAHFAPQLRELQELELIADRAGSLRLTDRGILFADEVFLRFAGPD